MVKQREVCKNDKKEPTSYILWGVRGGYEGSFYVKDFKGVDSAHRRHS
jgi:hypothetical protein